VRGTILNPEIKNGITNCPKCGGEIEVKKGSRCSCGVQLIGCYKNRGNIVKLTYRYNTG
jgi:hypothetical protein